MRRAEGHSRSRREPAVPHPIGCNNICQCPLSPGAGGSGGGAAIWVHTAKSNASSHTTTRKPFQQTHIPTIEGFRSSIKYVPCCFSPPSTAVEPFRAPIPSPTGCLPAHPPWLPVLLSTYLYADQGSARRAAFFFEEGHVLLPQDPCAHIQLSIL